MLEEKLNQNNDQKMLSDAEVQKRRNVANNANNVRAAAEIASKTNNPYAKAAGTAVKVADKISGGKASEKLGKTLNTAMKMQGLKGKAMQAAMNKMSESGTSNRIAAATNKKNNVPNTSLKKGTLTGSNVEDSSSKMKETEDQASDGGSAGLKISSKVIKWGLWACAFGFPIMIIICLFMSASQIMIKSVGLGNADSLSDQDVQDKINKKEDSDELSEEATEKEVSFDFFIDDEEDSIRNVKLSESNFVEIASIKYYKRKYNEADLEQLEDFYPNVRNLSNKYDKNLVYDFFYKMYNLYNYYRYKYNDVSLDLPLLMATLTIQSDDMSVVFASNLSNDERKKKYKDGYNSEDYADFDYYKDWSGYELTSDNSNYDMEILAQHMVSRQVRESCIDSSGNEVKYNILKDNEIGTQILFCDEGQTYKTGEPYFDKDDVKYKEFLKEFIEKKYYESGAIENSNNNNNNNNNNSNNSSSTGVWKNWKQCGESWSNIIVPKSNETMCQIGCLITSITIQIARSGTAIVTDSIDPGIAVKKYSFVSGGNFKWDSTTNLAPNFKYKTAINLAGMTKDSIAKKLSSYDPNKYYIVIAVSKVNKNKVNHYVALDYVDLQTNDLYMLDPGSSKDTNLYSTYKVYKAHIYEKKD